MIEAGLGENDRAADFYERLLTAADESGRKVPYYADGSRRRGGNAVPRRRRHVRAADGQVAEQTHLGEDGALLAHAHADLFVFLDGEDPHRAGANDVEALAEIPGVVDRVAKVEPPRLGDRRELREFLLGKGGEYGHGAQEAG